MPTMTSDLAFVTADIPGTGGVIKLRPEDFLVEEVPLYPASGAGEHLYVCIEKRQATTSDVVRRLAKLFGVRRGNIGYAGLKDKHAVTRQHFSVHLPDASEDQKLLERIAFTRFKLIWAKRHTNKLHRGHLLANRFEIMIRQVEPSGVLRAKAVLDHLARTGVPNFIGEQRFGYRQNNHALGRMLLLGQWKPMLDEMLGRAMDCDSPPTRQGRDAYDRGDFAGAIAVWPRHLHHDRQALDALRQNKPPEAAVMAIEAQQRAFLISSLQSAMFNQVLDRRLREGLLQQLLPGDLAWKHDSRAVFAVDDATAALENSPEGRVATMLVSPSGPMWGLGMPKTQGKVAQWEQQVLADNGLTEEDLARGPHATDGSRRPMRVPLISPTVAAGADEHGPFIRVAFSLPRGSFATVVLREITKADPSEAGRPIPGASECDT